MASSMFYIVEFLQLLLLAFFHRFFSKNKNENRVDRTSRIAIVGGGIGGVGAAYALLRDGFQSVTIYDAAEHLGGNAKTHLWNEGEKTIRTGLSVLAWPKFFSNYNRLLNDLQIPTTTVQLPFFIQNQQGIFAHGKICSTRYRQDLNRWKTMVNFVITVSTYLYGEDFSLYHFSLINPFNIIPLRLLCFLFRISNSFWNEVIVPMYASSFLSTRLAFIPSSILPSIDRIISLNPERIPTLETWMNTSVDVFDRMTRGATIKTNHRVEQVRIERKSTKIFIRIDNEPIVYDRVIFSCDSKSTLSALEKGQTSMSSLLKIMLKSVTYNDDEDLSLLDGFIHRDASILSPQYRNELLTTYANFIDVKSNYQYNTFILSSWLPTIRPVEPMLVTYAPADQLAPPIDPKKIVGRVNNRRAHPSLSLRNQIIALFNRLVQGENGLFFCGNTMTPANGHDLSLLSGFAVAEMLGAAYPLTTTSNDDAYKDFQRFKKMFFFS